MGGLGHDRKLTVMLDSGNPFFQTQIIAVKKINNRFLVMFDFGQIFLN